MDYCRGLPFDKKPNYRYLYSLFENLFRELNLEDDGQFDWILHKQMLLDRRANAEEAEKRARALE